MAKVDTRHRRVEARVLAGWRVRCRAGQHARPRISRGCGCSDGKVDDDIGDACTCSVRRCRASSRLTRACLPDDRPMTILCSASAADVRLAPHARSRFGRHFRHSSVATNGFAWSPRQVRRGDGNRCARLRTIGSCQARILGLARRSVCLDLPRSCCRPRVRRSRRLVRSSHALRGRGLDRRERSTSTKRHATRRQVSRVGGSGGGDDAGGVR